MTATARTRDGVVGIAVGAATLLWIALVATQGEGRWPWVLFVILAAAPFLLLPAPPVAEGLRTLLAGRAGRTVLLLTGVVVYGVVLSMWSGAGRCFAGHGWRCVPLWPLCIAGAALAVGIGQRGEPAAGRVVLVALLIALLAGVWDDRLQVRVPGAIDIALPYLAALDVALVLLLVVRPLSSLDPGFALSWRDLGKALTALGVLLVVALPLGYAIGFLRFNLRWEGAGYAAGRLFGLIVFVGLPEELLFRGLVQESFVRWWGERRGWALGSVLFGLTHIVKHAHWVRAASAWGSLLASIPTLNWRYALLATVAGLAYGWVYLRTRRLFAAALTHGLVDWLWSAFLLVP